MKEVVAREVIDIAKSLTASNQLFYTVLTGNKYVLLYRDHIYGSISEKDAQSLFKEARYAQKKMFGIVQAFGAGSENLDNPEIHFSKGSQPYVQSSIRVYMNYGNDDYDQFEAHLKSHGVKRWKF